MDLEDRASMRRPPDAAYVKRDWPLAQELLYLCRDRGGDHRSSPFPASFTLLISTLIYPSRFRLARRELCTHRRNRDRPRRFTPLPAAMAGPFGPCPLVSPPFREAALSLATCWRTSRRSTRHRNRHLRLETLAPTSRALPQDHRHENRPPGQNVCRPRGPARPTRTTWFFDVGNGGPPWDTERSFGPT